MSVSRMTCFVQSAGRISARNSGVPSHRIAPVEHGYGGTVLVGVTTLHHQPVQLGGSYRHRHRRSRFTGEVNHRVEILQHGADVGFDS